MNRERQQAIQKFLARNPKLDHLVTDILNSPDADLLIQKVGQGADRKTQSSRRDEVFSQYEL